MKTLAPDWAKLRKRRLYLAAPLYGGLLHHGFHSSVCTLLAQCMHHGVFVGTKYVTCDSLVARARNRLAAHFLDSDCTDFLFVDSDISFSADDVLSLVSLDEPIVGGIYSRKQIDWSRVVRASRAGIRPDLLPYFGTVPVLNWLAPADIRIDELYEVRHIGTGFLRIRREVFERLITAPDIFGSGIAFDYSSDEPHFRGRPGYDFFYSGVDTRGILGTGTRQYLSEDWGFAERARAAGYTIYAAPWVNLTHTGSWDFPNDFTKLDHPATRDADGPTPIDDPTPATDAADAIVMPKEDVAWL